MGRSQKNSAFLQSLRLETLEKRDLFAADLLVVGDWVHDERSVLTNYVNSRYFDFKPQSGELDKPVDQSDFDSTLKELATEYWKGVFGKTVADLIPPIQPYSPWFATADSLTLQSTAAQSSVMALDSSAANFRSINNARHDNIDEADSTDLNSDGFLYTVLGNAVHVVDLRDPHAIVSTKTIELQDYNARLFAFGDSLIVIQTIVQDPVPEDVFSPVYPVQTKVSLYDISDRTAPRAVSRTLVEGNNLAARFSNGQLTLVQDHQIVLPSPELVTGADGVKRFEQADSYFAAHREDILAALEPDTGHSTGDKLDLTDAGSWEDISFADTALSRSSSIFRFGLADGDLSLIDSETIAGLTVSMVYQGQEDIYLIANPLFQEPVAKSYIYKIDASSDGQLTASDAAEVLGRINDTSWLNEHDGVLQVASLGQTTTDPGGAPDPVIMPDGTVVSTLMFMFPTFASSANITTIGDTDDGWKVLGKLEDVAPGQALLSASFLGDRAVLTTGVQSLVRSFDPLHGIDLSDPANPVEMSELVIPGFTTYLLQVDETHWLGLGYDQDPNLAARNHLQVSLYKVENLADPVVVDSWVSEDIGWFGNWDRRMVSYDPATGLLTMVINQTSVDGKLLPTPLFKIDVSADDPLQKLGGISLPESVLRVFTLDNTYVAVTGHSVTTFDIDDPTTPLDRAYLENYDTLQYQYWSVPVGQSRDWRFTEIWQGEPFTIIAAETSGPITATLNEDHSVKLTATEATGYTPQTLYLTIEFESGVTREISVSIYSYVAYEEPTYAPGRGSVQGRFTDELGNPVSDPSAGDEVWVTISATDFSPTAGGVFAAYVDIGFDTGNVTVLGELEHLGEYVNGRAGVLTETGIKYLGGFGDEKPSDNISSDIARFKIRIEDDQPVSLSIKPSTEHSYEFLVYGLSKAIDPAQVLPSNLITQFETVRTVLTAESREQDINSDGSITALDVLQVVNYINARNSTTSVSVQSLASPESSGYDLTGDGVVSGADVLQIVNTINARFANPASGEASEEVSQISERHNGSLDAAAVDQLFAIDMDTLPRKK